MFIYEPNSTIISDKLIKSVEEKMGVMPPHWTLFAKMNPKRFKMFIDEIAYILNHSNIKSDFFAMTRLFVANHEGFEYCKSFNTKLLLAREYKREELVNIKSDFVLPLDSKHQILANGVKKAIFDADNFTGEDIEILKSAGWSDSDVWDAIDHGAFLFKFSKILKAYLA